MIHRAESLGTLLATFSGRFGGLVILPLHPRAGQPARRVIVRGVKGSRKPLRILPGLVLHSSDGRFRKSVDGLLRSPRALDLDSDGAGDDGEN